MFGDSGNEGRRDWGEEAWREDELHLQILSLRYLWNIQLKLVLEQGCPTEHSAMMEILFACALQYDSATEKRNFSF